SRPRWPSRRPRQRYVPGGAKEGPMKGFAPPPRLSLSNEPLPITRNITITEGISVKDLAEKLGIRAKDLIARLLAKGVFATINQTLDAELASEMARFFGAETSVISFEEQAAKEVAETAAGEEGVAADDRVMPQTIEAIDRAHAAEVPIIVAVNKIDKPGALPERVKKQLADRGLMPEDRSGKTVFVDVSAKQKTNLNLLLEMICLV